MPDTSLPSPYESTDAPVPRRVKIFRVILRYGVAVIAIGFTLLIKLVLKDHLEMGIEREADRKSVV